MKIDPLITIEASLDNAVHIGTTPLGTRTVHGVQGGKFTGERLNGLVLPGGADWLLTDSQGVGRIDVRMTLRTNDGANIQVQYPGIVVATEQVSDALASGDPTNFGDAHFVIQPRFETGDPRYRWVNDIIAIGEGRFLPNGAEYRIYECHASR